MQTTNPGQKEWISLSIMGRDRPGIIAGVSRVLYQNRYNIEDLSQTAIRGQFAMILIASSSQAGVLEPLRNDCRDLSRELGLDIYLRSIHPEDLAPFAAGEVEPFVITVRGEDRPGLVYGITSVLAERRINITNLDAKVTPVGDKFEYLQLYEVDIPKTLDFQLIQEKLRERGQEMGVVADLQHRDIFRAINQI